MVTVVTVVTMEMIRSAVDCTRQLPWWCCGK